jgi:hypothetical protein
MEQWFAGFRDVTDNLAAFVPALMGAAVLLLAGWLIGRTLAWAARRAVHALLGRLASQPALHRAIQSSGAAAQAPIMIGGFVFWVVFVFFVAAALETLGLPVVTASLSRVAYYLPNVLAALLILVLGVILSRFVARSALIAAVNYGFPFASLLSGGVRWLLLLVAWAMAFEHLGIGRGILTLAFGILFGGIVLALALAVGLGSKELVGRSLERHVREPRERPDKLTHV